MGRLCVYKGRWSVLALRPTHRKKMLTQSLAEGNSSLNKRLFVGPTQNAPPPPYVSIPHKQNLLMGLQSNSPLDPVGTERENVEHRERSHTFISLSHGVDVCSAGAPLTSIRMGSSLRVSRMSTPSSWKQPCSRFMYGSEPWGQAWGTFRDRPGLASEHKATHEGGMAPPHTEARTTRRLPSPVVPVAGMR